MSDAVEQEAERAPAVAPKEAEATVVEAFDFSPGGAPMGYARQLARGFQGAADTPLPPGHGTNSGILALQRTAGNRAVARSVSGRRMLARHDLEEDEEFAYVVEAPGPNDAVSRASDVRTADGGAFMIVVLDAATAFVYDSSYKLRSRHPLKTRVAWDPGVWVQDRKSDQPGASLAFYRVLLKYGENGREYSYEGSPSVPVGRRLKKAANASVAPPVASEAPKTELMGLGRLVADPVAYAAALQEDAPLMLVIPRYTSGAVKKGASGTTTGYDTIAMAGGESDPPNAPAYPAHITGPQLAVEGGRNDYTMELEWQSSSRVDVASVAEAAVHVQYSWERWKLPSALDDKQKSAADRKAALEKETAAIKAAKGGGENVSGDLEATAQRWGDSYRNELETLKRLHEHKQVAGEDDDAYLADTLADEVALRLAPASWLRSVGGNLLDTIIDVRPQRHVEKEMPWPRGQKGMYLVRCIAQPAAQFEWAADGGKEKDKAEVIRRAPSIAAMLVEVREANELAQESLDKPEADLQAVESQIAETTRAKQALEAEIEALRNVSPRTQEQDDALQTLIDRRARLYMQPLAELDKQRHMVQLNARGTTADLLAEIISRKTTEELPKAAGDPKRHATIAEEIEALKNQQTVAQNRANKIYGSAPKPEGWTRPTRIPRMQATFTSSVTGQSYPLLLDLLEYPDSVEGNFHFCISDVTTKDSSGDPNARGETRYKTLRSALTLYTQQCGLGPGVIAARVPGTEKSDFGSTDVTVASAEVGYGVMKERLTSLALIATIVGTALLGPAAAMAGKVLLLAGGVGAAVAAMNLIDRGTSGTLRADAAALNDVIAIIGALIPGVTAVIEKVVVIPLNDAYVVASAAKLGGTPGEVAATVAKVKDALAQLTAATRTVTALEKINELLGNAGLFMAGAETVEQIQKIQRALRDNKISRNEAARQQGAAMMSALGNTGMYFFGHAKSQESAQKPKDAVSLAEAQGRQKARQRERNQTPEEKAASGKLREPAGEEAVQKERERQQRADEEVKKRAADDANGVKPVVEEDGPALPKEDERQGGKEDPVHVTPAPAPGKAGVPVDPAAVAKETFRRAVHGDGDLPTAARDLVTTLGQWKGELRDYARGFDKTHLPLAEDALVTARKAMVDRAWEAATTPEQRATFEKFNVGTDAFASDIDITVKPKDEHLGATADTPAQIKEATEIAGKFKDALREEVTGQETDRAIDTNVYSYIGEGKLTASSTAERAARNDFERVIGLAELLRGGGPAKFAEFLALVRGKLSGDALAIKHFNELAVQAKAFAEARAAESKVAGDAARKANPSAPPEARDRIARDAILAEKKAKLAAAASKSPIDISEVTRLQSEVLWFEPDAYASRAAIDQGVHLMQATKAAGSTITLAEELSAAQSALDAARAAKDEAAIQQADQRLSRAWWDEHRILVEEGKLSKLEAEVVGDDAAKQAAHEKAIKAQLGAVDAAKNAFRSRMVKEAVEVIEARTDAKGATPAEQRAHGAGAGASNLGMLAAHLKGMDPGAAVKYVCKYGGRVLHASMLGGMKVKGSVAIDQLIGMFTRSRWASYEGKVGEVLRRDMLIEYAEKTGRPVNRDAAGKAIGVPPEVDAAFVQDVQSFLEQANAQLWAAGLTEESAKSGMPGAPIRDTTHEQGAAPAHATKAAFEQAFATAVAPLSTAVNPLLKAVTNSLALVRPSAANDVLVRRLPEATNALCDLEGIKRVALEVWQLAADQRITTREALERLAGGGITDVDASLSSEDFRDVLRRDGPFRDAAFGSDVHGSHTHIFQELVVSRALGGSAGKELRHAIAEATGPTIEGREFWSAAWDGLYDADYPHNGASRPEALGEILQTVLGLPRTAYENR